MSSFLPQLVAILQGVSDETIASLMSRQACHIGSLPPSEEVWAVPLADSGNPRSLIPAKAPDMVYGRGGLIVVV